jgi:calcium/calmodulin-dependent protein kinase I
MEGEEDGRPYEFLELLGRGAFGKVYRCLNRESHSSCAVKILSKAHFRSELTSILNEVRILSSLHHPNIVQFCEVRQSHNHVYIEMELLLGGTLQTALESHRFDDSAAAEILKGVMSAVSYLHSHDIIHRDLKPANIIFVESPSIPHVKLTDFGLSAKFTEANYLQSLYQNCGTMSFMAPEQAQSRPYSRPVDIWSCGIILYMLLEGVHPLLAPQETKDSYIEKLQAPKWNFGKGFSPLARDLFERMVAVEPLERYTADQVLRHPWITRQNDEIPRTFVERVQTYNDQSRFKRLALKCCAVAALTHKQELPYGAYNRMLVLCYNPLPRLVVTRVMNQDPVPLRQTTTGFFSPQKLHTRSTSNSKKTLSPSFTRLGVSPVQSPGRKATASRVNTARYVK